MTDRRKKILNKLLKANPSEAEQKMLDIVIERVTIDMAEFYEKFFKAEGPGAMVYAPKSEDNTMFYLTVDLLIKAVNDANSRELGGVEHLRKAISIAESLDPEKEALFILQDKDDIQLFHFKTDEENPSLLQM